MDTFHSFSWKHVGVITQEGRGILSSEGTLFLIASKSMVGREESSSRGPHVCDDLAKATHVPPLQYPRLGDFIASYSGRVLRLRCTIFFLRFPQFESSRPPKDGFGEKQNSDRIRKIPWPMYTTRIMQNKKGPFPTILGQRSSIIQKIFFAKKCYLYI